jgi:integrase/recombinase XerD
MNTRSDLDAYLDALYLERGLSETTLRAYRVDLEGASLFAQSLNQSLDTLADQTSMPGLARCSLTV